MDTFSFALSKEKYPWILFPEMKSYPFAERALVRPLRSELLQLDYRESKTLLFSFSNPHKNYDFNNFISGKSIHGYFSRNTVRGKVSMDTFPGFDSSRGSRNYTFFPHRPVSVNIHPRPTSAYLHLR